MNFFMPQSHNLSGRNPSKNSFNQSLQFTLGLGIRSESQAWLVRHSGIINLCSTPNKQTFVTVKNITAKISNN